jgi:polyphosphate glucokinase
MELGLLKFDASRSLLDELSVDGLERQGRGPWRRKVIKYVYDLAGAFCVNDVVLGGGNACRVAPLPKKWRQRDNSHALLGATRLWGDRDGIRARPCGSIWHITDPE